MRGAPTDNNATLFAQGYMRRPQPALQVAASGRTSRNPAGTWDPPTAETEFQQAFTANPTANAAALAQRRERAHRSSPTCRSQGVKPYTFPVTGQDATLVGLQNIICGYQCGTVYKPIFLEAQAAAALAMYLRAGMTPPKALSTARPRTPSSNVAVPSVLETPEWVTPTNDGEDDRRRQVRAGVAALRGRLRGGLHEVRDPLANKRTRL